VNKKFVLPRMMFPTQEPEDAIRSVRFKELRYRIMSKTIIESVSLKSCSEMIESQKRKGDRDLEKQTCGRSLNLPPKLQVLP
jgi:hypothetical protein